MIVNLSQDILASWQYNLVLDFLIAMEDKKSLIPEELRLYDDIVRRVEDLPSVRSVLADIDDASLAHFLLREFNLLRDSQDLVNHEAYFGNLALVEQALGIAAVQALKDMIQSRNDSPTALQEALQQLARNRLADMASSRTSTEWLLLR